MSWATNDISFLLFDVLRRRQAEGLSVCAQALYTWEIRAELISAGHWCFGETRYLSSPLSNPILCADYVDDIFLSPFVCLSERASFSLVNDCVTWNGNESIKIARQQWGELFICKQADGCCPPHNACMCACSPSGDRYCAWWNHCVFFFLHLCEHPNLKCVIFCHLCVRHKLWPAFSRRLLSRTERRLCQTEGTAATTVLEY